MPNAIVSASAERTDMRSAVSPLRKQQRFVIASSVDNVHHFYRVGTDAIEYQIVAERASADAEMFVT
jgi:hypothetical protein